MLRPGAAHSPDHFREAAKQRGLPELGLLDPKPWETLQAPEDLPRDQLRALAASRRATELLVVRVQNFFVPQLRGGRYHASAVVGLTDDAAKWTFAERERFDYADAATDCGVTPEELAALSQDLGIRGDFTDSIKDLFWLLDQADRSQREKMTGAPRRALDFYDASRILRAWHQRITGEFGPDVDELVGFGAEQAKQRLFGSRELRGHREVLPAILERYGLYPYRVEVIGEGESELAALEEILEQGYGLTFARLGIHKTDMTGADIPKDAERLLRSLRTYSNYFLLVFDNEGRASELVENLLRAKVVEGVSDTQRAEALRGYGGCPRAGSRERRGTRGGDARCPSACSRA